jgi:hypothetical protein
VLPLMLRFDQGWELLALSGGRPITIAAEFDGATLLPLGSIISGRFRALSWPEAEVRTAALPAPEGPPELVRAWQEATTCALLGVGRRPPAFLASDSPLGQALRRLGGREPAERLLGASALLTLYGRIGRKPAIDADPPPSPARRTTSPNAGRSRRRACGGCWAGGRLVVCPNGSACRPNGSAFWPPRAGGCHLRC